MNKLTMWCVAGLLTLLLLPLSAQAGGLGLLISAGDPEAGSGYPGDHMERAGQDG